MERDVSNTEIGNVDAKIDAFREGYLNYGLRYVDAWGVHGVTEQPSPCGCRAVGNGHLKDPLRVQFCETHAAVIIGSEQADDPKS